MQTEEVCGGAGGIRTHGTIAGTPDFESFELLVTAVFLSAFSVRLVPPKFLAPQGFFQPDTLKSQYLSMSARICPGPRFWKELRKEQREQRKEQPGNSGKGLISETDVFSPVLEHSIYHVSMKINKNTYLDTQAGPSRQTNCEVYRDGENQLERDS